MYILCIYVASQVLLVVKNPPANTKDVRDRVQSLSWEDPLEEGPAARCSSFWLENLTDRGAWRAHSLQGCKESDTTEATKHTCTHTIYDVLLVDVKYIYT